MTSKIFKLSDKRSQDLIHGWNTHAIVQFYDALVQTQLFRLSHVVQSYELLVHPSTSPRQALRQAKALHQRCSDKLNYFQLKLNSQLSNNHILKAL